MYNKKEIDKITYKLRAIKNKLLMNDCNSLFIINDWVVKDVEILDNNLFTKKTISTKYYIESISYISKNTPESSITFSWSKDNYYCTHKGINTLILWRNNWLYVQEQLKLFGYKLNK